MKYNGTYSCGHDGVCDVIGPGKDREWKINRHFSRPCPECADRIARERAEKAAKDAAEQGIPALTGSDKQIAWATEIRASFLREVEAENMRADGPDADAILTHLITHCTRASYWIDCRGQSAMSITYDYVDEHCEALKQYLETRREAADETVQAAQQEQMISPESPISDAAAEIRVSVGEDGVSGEVAAAYIKDDTFRAVLGKQYTWNREARVWQRKITSHSGPVRDRAAELALALLAAGIRVIVHDAETRDMVMRQEYLPEQVRWITGGAKGLYISFPRDEELNASIRRVPTAHWDRAAGCYIADTTAWRELLDFADIYGFRVSSRAQEIVEAHRERLAASSIVQPVQITTPEPPDKLADILNTPADVIDDLKDNDFEEDTKVTREQFIDRIFEHAGDDMDSIKAADVECVCGKLESRFGEIVGGWESAIVDAADVVCPGDLPVRWLLQSDCPEELGRAKAYMEKCAGIAAAIFGLFDGEC